MADIQELLRSEALVVQKYFESVLSFGAVDGEIYRPRRLVDAMRYGALNGGKRLRPYLVLQVGKMLGANRQNLVHIATAIECVHCYSLVHDDLPAMDDDDLRRGKPTLHKAFDEASAILAGDGLLTYAFDLLSDVQTHPDPEIRLQLISGLSKAIGMGGMVGGQMLDVFSESAKKDMNSIARMQAMKTGALIKFSCVAGAIVAKADDENIIRISRYGELVGQAFQLTDDILDVVSNPEILGKQVTKDSEKGKITEVTTLGVEKARELVANLIKAAESQLEDFGSEAKPLLQIAEFVKERKH